MKKIVLGVKLSLLTLLVGMGFTSCSSDDGTVSTPQSEASLFKPALKSDITIYSGGDVLATTMSGDVLTSAMKDAVTRAAVSTTGQFQYYKVQDGNVPSQYKSVIPAAVSTDEKTFVINYIKEHPDQGGVAFNNIDYFIQYAGSSKDSYATKDQNNAAHSVVGSDHMDQIEINGQTINDYNAGGGPDALCLNLPLANPSYQDSYGDTDNRKYDAYKIYEISYNGKTGYYLGFDYKTKKGSGEVVNGDGIYNDYILKLTPADDNGNNVDPTPIVVNEGEVEANLSVNAEKKEGDYIATKLSLHVRGNTDVSVFIPVPAQYYCQADDMSIVLSHQMDDEKYNDTPDYTTMTFNINGQPVSLKVAYELDGIRVTTSGINPTVLSYLEEKYKDGVTFEVWNYYKSSVDINGVTSDFTRGMLKNQFLDNSTITFTDGTENYINAFGSIPDYSGKVYDKVDPTTGVRTPYTDPGLTQELDTQYWDRSTSDPRYYTLHSKVNEWDCTVVPDKGYVLQGVQEGGYNKIYQKTN
jgi:hypothetical protein